MNLDKPWAMDIGPGNLDLDWLSVKDGLLLVAPFQVSGDYYSIANGRMQSLVTETVDADGTQRSWGGQIIGATANVARAQPGRGVLVEGARTNLCLQSEDFGTTWIPSNAVVATNQIVAPDGQTTADKITDNGGGAAVYQDFAGGVLTNNLQYTTSVFVKEGTSGDFSLQLRDVGGAADRARADYEWSGGVLTVKAEDVGTAAVEAYPNGWYRASLTCPVNMVVGANIHRILFYPTENGAGSTGDYLYGWGAQLEPGAFASSYIPTTSASLLRAAEVLDIDNTNDVHLSKTAGTFLAACTPAAILTSQYIFDTFTSSGGLNGFRLRLIDGKPTFRVYSGGATQAVFNATDALTAGTKVVLAMAWATNDVRGYVNGGDEKADTTVTVPTALDGSVTIGGRVNATTENFFGTIEHVLIYNRAFTAGEIAQVTRDIQEVLA